MIINYMLKHSCSEIICILMTLSVICLPILLYFNTYFDHCCNQNRITIKIIPPAIQTSPEMREDPHNPIIACMPLKGFHW